MRDEDNEMKWYHYGLCGCGVALLFILACGAVQHGIPWIIKAGTVAVLEVLREQKVIP